MNELQECKHTKGPWHTLCHSSNVGGGDYRVTIAGDIRAECFGGQVALAYGSDLSKDEVESNARLIAAAPDLLAALKALYKECAMIHKYGGEGCNQKQADAAISAGLAAIAKAEAR